MSVLTDFLELLDGLLGSAAYFPIVLLGAGVFFTFYLGFPQIRFFKHAVEDRSARGSLLTLMWVSSLGAAQNKP